MFPNNARVACFTALLVIGSIQLTAASSPVLIAANDNRIPAGKVADGTLTVRLELAEGQWHPDKDDGPAFTIYAFGEAGKQLQNPGPLIRVPEGTEIRAFVHNALPVAAAVHGLYTRPGDDRDALLVQPGATQETRFKAGAPGSYYYWATTTGGTILKRTSEESQLGGAFIVDPPGAVAADRVFVIGVYFQGGRRVGSPQEATINGKAWPYAERLTMKLGEPVRWRWLNISFSEHSMHLHGFYYHVDATGDGKHSQTFKESERPMVVTRFMEEGDTFDMTWVPDRTGRWLFHCHMMIHMSPTDWNAMSVGPQNGHGISRLVPGAEDKMSMAAAGHGHQPDDGTEPAGMGGLVLGITVVSDKEMTPVPNWHAERKLKLTINEHQDSGRRAYALDVRDPAQAPASPPPASTPLVGPPIVLTAGQAVEIEVANRTSGPTTIHWHGIELESYYDGVVGWTGTSERSSPPIQSGTSFVARMAPPRAGTFIYHTHWHDEGQLNNGIFGPLIVLPPGRQFEPATDKVFIFSSGVFEPFGKMALINGGPQPARMLLATGKKFRFRLINISDNFARMRVSLRRNGTPVQWRILAKDGAELPRSAATLQSAETTITVGETYDVEYEASSPQDLVLEILLPLARVRASQGLLFTESGTLN